MRQRRGLVAGTAACGIGLAGGLAAWAVRGKTCNWLAPSVHQGPAHRREIALTFDDGPSPSTPRIQQILDEHGAKGTFFQCGMHVRRRPGISRDLLAAGHELGNHTETHPNFAFQSARSIEEEIGRAQHAIWKAADVQARLFRPPYGVRWHGLRAAQARHGLLGVMWTVMGRDWRLSAREIEIRLMKRAKNGAILCLHDGRDIQADPDISQTIEAVKKIVPVLQTQGYRLVTVSELLRVEC